METLSLKTRIVNYLVNQDRWFSKQELVDIIKGAFEAEKKGITTDYISRALRDLSEGKNPQIQRDYYKGDKNQDLVKYSALKVEKEIKPQLQVSIVEINGQVIAKII